MECSNCHKIFATKYTLKKHNDDQVCLKHQIICQLCGKHFADRSGLSYHTTNNVCVKSGHIHHIDNKICTKKSKITLKLKKIDVNVPTHEEKILRTTNTPCSLQHVPLPTPTPTTSQPQSLTSIKEGKYKKMKIPTAMKQIIWIQYIGESIKGKCYCCGITEITSFNFEAGHVIAESHNGLMITANLRPICSSCNRSMHNKNMREFVKIFYPNSLLLKEQNIQ